MPLKRGQKKGAFPIDLVLRRRTHRWDSVISGNQYFTQYIIYIYNNTLCLSMVRAQNDRYIILLADSSAQQSLYHFLR